MKYIPLTFASILTLQSLVASQSISLPTVTTINVNQPDQNNCNNQQQQQQQFNNYNTNYPNVAYINYNTNQAFNSQTAPFLGSFTSSNSFQQPYFQSSQQYQIQNQQLASNYFNHPGKGIGNPHNNNQYKKPHPNHPHNVVKGKNNLVNGFGNVISGKQNVVHGNGNIIASGSGIQNIDFSDFFKERNQKQQKSSSQSSSNKNNNNRSFKNNFDFNGFSNGKGNLNQYNIPINYNYENNYNHGGEFNQFNYQNQRSVNTNQAINIPSSSFENSYHQNYQASIPVIANIVQNRIKCKTQNPKNKKGVRPMFAHQRF